ncbi:hypothetical protein JAAARDRAFT_55835 [Jaapia argillacea MUCL 33604]|uniref:Uncharacterized protein n=1 Tax=Jaapia argillacea MUCL 33604 TaxID=933084 RepID=A0A067QES3_9AGAM|nr:hypothetical protein JAAARDRAFT_55835 [Jaapia argillacea MUCL 33604]
MDVESHTTQGVSLVTNGYKARHHYTVTRVSTLVLRLTRISIPVDADGQDSKFEFEESDSESEFSDESDDEDYAGDISESESASDADSDTDDDSDESDYEPRFDTVSIDDEDEQWSEDPHSDSVSSLGEDEEGEDNSEASVDRADIPLRDVLQHLQTYLAEERLADQRSDAHLPYEDVFGRLFPRNAYRLHFEPQTGDDGFPTTIVEPIDCESPEWLTHRALNRFPRFF